MVLGGVVLGEGGVRSLVPMAAGTHLTGMHS